jgi:transcriptional regulator with XRE-family HTH domain
MTDAPYTDDLDLAAVSTASELAEFLRTVHLRADRPSLRVLEARTRHELTPLSKTAVSEMLKGTRFPRKAVMIAFLKACGERDDRIEEWRHTWERIATVQYGPASTPAAGRVPLQSGHGVAIESGGGLVPETAEAKQLRAEIDRLNEDNRRLRLQAAAAARSDAAPQTVVGGTGVRQARGPELPRRMLGAKLRALRVAQDITVEQVAAHLLCSVAEVNRMENGFRSGRLRDIRDLCELYCVSDADQRDYLMDLARQSKRRGWWQEYSVFSSTFMGLEADATSLKDYNPIVVMGLLQTADYARTVIESISAGQLNSDRIERLVQARLIRQHLLTRNNPLVLSAVLDEAILHRIVGSAAVMAVQLDHLIDLSRLDNVTIEVIPYGSGAHAGFNAFDILEFDAALPGVVYLEGVFGELYFEKPEEVDRFQKIFSVLREKALDEEDSRALIGTARRSLQI